MLKSVQMFFESYSQNLFQSLTPEENLILQMSGEECHYLRWNSGRIRQSTEVEQFEVTWTYQWKERQLELTLQLTLNLQQDLALAQEFLERLRAQAPLLEVSHQLAPLIQAERHVSIGAVPQRDMAEVAATIENASQGLDLVGFWASGPILRGVSHSQGLFLFEARDTYFFDYSIFTKTSREENKAVKGFFSESSWQEDWGVRWQEQLQHLKKDLEILTRPNHAVPPGKYRTYLSPSALQGLIDTLKWGGFSYASYKTGQCPFKDLIEKRARLSKLVTLRENFTLGFAPHFNSLGELPPEILPLIEQGEHRNSLICGKTAKEYQVISNGGESGGWGTESPRSLEMLPGDLAPEKALETLGTGIWVNEVHYCNYSDRKSARITGMTRYACFWVENGEIIAPIEDLRFDVNMYNLFGEDLIALTQKAQDLRDVGTYHLRNWAGNRLPGALVRNFEFTL